jgi:hypothetical protein
MRRSLDKSLFAIAPSGFCKKGIRRIALALFLLTGSAGIVTGLTYAEQALEYPLKAAFIQKFTKFIEWPGENLPDPHAPRHIAVLGDSPIKQALQELIRTDPSGHSLALVEGASAISAKNYHILFVPRSESPRLQQILKNLPKAPVLTVGESDGFCAGGGMINFYFADDKIRFEINPERAEEAGLKISSKLLRLARICKTE